jgi:hypothetical protein
VRDRNQPPERSANPDSATTSASGSKPSGRSDREVYAELASPVHERAQTLLPSPTYASRKPPAPSARPPRRTA